jgi:hypothetical protein
MCREFLGRSARFEIAITIGKSNHAVSICDVQELRVVAWWIKGNAERLIQIAFCKSFSHIRFAIAVCIAHHLDLIGATLYNENVAIRCGKEKSRIAKSSSVQFDFEPRWNFGLRTGWPVNHTRPINCESIRTWRRQILYRDFARDTGRIARPIAHCGFAGEERTTRLGGVNRTSEMETGRNNRDTEPNTSAWAMCHCFLESIFVRSSRGLEEHARVVFAFWGAQAASLYVSAACRDREIGASSICV